jgi:WD domain, G-beta repeat/WD40-like Beta Propeller Repeat
MTFDELLRDAPLPDEGAARERARRTILAAHAAAPRRSRPRTAAIATTVILALAGAGALTRPGQAVGEWVGKRLDVVERRHEPAAPAERRSGFDLLRGRLLVAGEQGLAIVGRDGQQRRLGDWTSGSWSPHGLHVAAASGRTLAAIRPDGTVKWRHSAPAPVADPSWAPDGFYIAYRAGAKLHVIWGNGKHDVPFRGRAAPAAPAWRPSDPHTVAWGRADGTVLVQDAYTGLVLWRHAGGRVRHLAWSADGARLLIAGRRHGAIHTLATGRTRPLRLGGTLLAAAFAPAGTRLALATSANGVTRVSLLGAKAALLEQPGSWRALTWSPDGRWLLSGADGRLLLTRTRGGPTVLELPRAGSPQDWVGP